ncbi:peptidase, partial [Vibrio anguillarum]
MRINMKPIVFSFLVVMSSSVLADELDIGNVSQEGIVLKYYGTISYELNEKLFKLYEEAKVKPSTLYIESDGGDVELGMDLGDWVYEKKLDIVVDSYCLSSCANYVFPSSNHKSIGNQALIGYHGGANSASLDISDIDDMYKELPLKQRKEKQRELRLSMNEYLKRIRVRELEFYNKIGVKSELVTLGEQEKYQVYDEDIYVGWTYRPESFESLGVDNVKVLSPPWKLIDY